MSKYKEKRRLSVLSEIVVMENLIYLSREDNEGDEKFENIIIVKLFIIDFENEL